mmetsp:Transcript_30738/g.49744  ORF Transcript_30738/g.49744 Transcript_30738/m.49744 type:complete len:232 (-) Transcript_30738:238-933(-)
MSMIPTSLTPMLVGRWSCLRSPLPSLLSKAQVRPALPHPSPLHPCPPDLNPPKPPSLPYRTIGPPSRWPNKPPNSPPNPPPSRLSASIHRIYNDVNEHQQQMVPLRLRRRPSSRRQDEGKPQREIWSTAICSSPPKDTQEGHYHKEVTILLLRPLNLQRHLAHHLIEPKPPPALSTPRPLTPACTHLASLHQTPHPLLTPPPPRWQHWGLHRTCTATLCPIQREELHMVFI